MFGILAGIGAFLVEGQFGLIERILIAAGILLLGIYVALDPEDVRGYVAHYGFRFPVAIDEGWTTLRRWWLDGHERREFTSVSFVIDRRGVIRHVHKGGKYAPGDSDYERIREQIEALLSEPER